MAARPVPPRRAGLRSGRPPLRPSGAAGLRARLSAPRVGGGDVTGSFQVRDVGNASHQRPWRLSGRQSHESCQPLARSEMACRRAVSRASRQCPDGGAPKVRRADRTHPRRVTGSSSRQRSEPPAGRGLRPVPGACRTAMSESGPAGRAVVPPNRSVAASECRSSCRAASPRRHGVLRSSPPSLHATPPTGGPAARARFPELRKLRNSGIRFPGYSRRLFPEFRESDIPSSEWPIFPLVLPLTRPCLDLRREGANPLFDPPSHPCCTPAPLGGGYPPPPLPP